MPSTNLRSYSNSTVAITYTSFQLDQKSLSIIKEGVKEKINLSKSSFPLAKGLVGCSENSKRIIIAPHSLSVSI